MMFFCFVGGHDNSKCQRPGPDGCRFRVRARDQPRTRPRASAPGHAAGALDDVAPLTGAPTRGRSQPGLPDWSLPCRRRMLILTVMATLTAISGRNKTCPSMSRLPGTGGVRYPRRHRTSARCILVDVAVFRPGRDSWQDHDAARRSRPSRGRTGFAWSPYPGAQLP